MIALNQELLSDKGFGDEPEDVRITLDNTFDVLGCLTSDDPDEGASILHLRTELKRIIEELP